jgi:hypothetical protein
MYDADAIGALTAKVNELARVCARLSQENAELRGQVSALSAPAAPGGQDGRAGEGAGKGRISRRAAVGVALAGAAAAGIAGAAVLTERGQPRALTAEAIASAELTAAEVAHTPPAATGSVISASLSTAAATVAVANTNAGPGVHATSTSGRGGIFGGAAAQIQLTPAGATHPKSGQRGDLYADTTGRLWYCKGSTTWHQIA